MYSRGRIVYRPSCGGLDASLPGKPVEANVTHLPFTRTNRETSNSPFVTPSARNAQRGDVSHSNPARSQPGPSPRAFPVAASR